MTRISNNPLLYQAFIVIWMLVLVSIGFVTAWVFISQKAPTENRRPAFNLKEL